MKKLLIVMFSIVMMVMLAACGSSGNTNSQAKSSSEAAAGDVQVAKSIPGGNHKVLIAYFSWGGNTAKAAEQIHGLVGGDMFRIETATPYPTEYKPTTEVAKKEKADNARPALKGKVDNWKDYDVIFVGYPIWWHDAPMAVYSFMEQNDMTGKIIIPFCTSGGSSIDESMPGIKKLAAKGTLVEGWNGSGSESAHDWLVKIGMIKA